MQRKKFPLVLLLSFLLSLFSLTGCNSFRPSWIDENYWSVEEGEISPDDFDAPLGGHFNEDDEWIPDDPTIELTYKIPDISAGFLFDAKTYDVTPSIQVELLEFDIPGAVFNDTFLRWIRTWKLDFGVAYQRTFIYLGPRITSIFEISIGGFFGWNWKERDLTYGIGFTIIKF